MSELPAIYTEHLAAVSARDTDTLRKIWEPTGIVEFPYAENLSATGRLEGIDAILTYFGQLELFGPFTFSAIKAWQIDGAHEWLAELHGSSTVLATGAPYEQDYVVRFRTTPGGTLAWMREYWDPTRLDGNAATTDDDVKRRLATAFHRALLARDWDLLRTIMTPEVSWTLPGDNRISGTAAGVDAVIERAELIAAYGPSFELEHVLFSRDNMALAIHNQATRGDLVLDEHLATVCTLTDGKISNVETYLSDVAGMDAFFTDEP